MLLYQRVLSDQTQRSVQTRPCRLGLGDGKPELPELPVRHYPGRSPPNVVSGSVNISMGDLQDPKMEVFVPKAI